MELLRRWTQTLGEQPPAAERQGELAAAAGRERRSLDADDVAEVEANEQLERLRAKQILPRMQLDLTAAIAKVEKSRLAVSPARNDSTGDPMFGIRFDPGCQTFVGGTNLGDFLALGELRRKRLNPRGAQARQLLAPVSEEI